MITKQDSEIISMLRFPLIVGVVFIHSQLSNIDACGLCLQHFLGGSFGAIAVPLFLIISGYLFYNNIEVFSRDVYKRKILSRIKSLLIPYLIWNTIAYLLYAYKFGFNILHLIKAYWSFDMPNREESSPADGPLWYIRNLLLIVIFLSPIIFWLIKRTKYYLIIPMGILWLLNVYPFGNGRGIAFLFFYVGAYMSLSDRQFAINGHKCYLCVAFFCLLSILCQIVPEKYFVFEILLRLNKVAGIFSILSVVTYLQKKKVRCGGAILASSSFFIYCCHDLFLPFLKSVIAIDENNEFWRYLIVVGTDLVLCLLLYKIVVWVFPKTSKYLTGGR